MELTFQIRSRFTTYSLAFLDFINPENGECSNEWREWFNHRMEQVSQWLVEDACRNYELPPSKECEPPRGMQSLACEWKVFRKTEVEVKWKYDVFGPMILSDNIAYDGKNLYNPLNGRQWENFIEFLEAEVKRKYREAFPDLETDVFDRNNGIFWSLLLQQWYDIISVSLLLR